MHALFVHRNFPAQFGQIAGALVREHGWRCTFLSERAQGEAEGVRLLRYSPVGGATEATHSLARSFENAAAHAEGVLRAFRTLPDLAGTSRPDVIVGHSGFGSTALLPEVTDAPIVNYFEYYYRTRGSEADFRPDFPVGEEALLRARLRNAMILTDLVTCDAAYAPTAWQRSLFPAELRPKIETIHDGIDTTFWSRTAPAGGTSSERGAVPRTDTAADPGPPREALAAILGRPIPQGTRIVTYVARGFESMRGFDVFVRAAKRVLAARSDVLVVAVGEDRVCYGGDEEHTGGAPFGAWVLSRENPDTDRLLLPGRLAPERLALLLAHSDVHVHLTVPFVLSWSLLNAMASECVVVASGTDPVREFVTDGENGLLADFFDDAGIAARVLGVLADPAAHRPLGAAARRTVEERASLARSLPRLKALFEGAGRSRR